MQLGFWWLTDRLHSLLATEEAPAASAATASRPLLLGRKLSAQVLPLLDQMEVRAPRRLPIPRPLPPCAPCRAPCAFSLAPALCRPPRRSPLPPTRAPRRAGLPPHLPPPPGGLPLRRSQALLAQLDSEVAAASSLCEAYDALGLLPTVLQEGRALPAPPGAPPDPSNEAIAARWTRHVRAQGGATDAS